MQNQYTNIPKYYSSFQWQELRREVLRRDKGVCRYCGDPAFTADYVIPRKAGGPDAALNLVAVCQRCNKLAGGLIFKDVESKKQWVLHRLGRAEQCAEPITPDEWAAIAKVLGVSTKRKKKRRT